MDITLNYEFFFYICWTMWEVDIFNSNFYAYENMVNVIWDENMSFQR